MADYDFDEDSYLASVREGYASRPPPSQALPARPEGGFQDAFAQSIGHTVSGVGRMASDFIPGVSEGNALRRWGDEYASAHPTAVHSLGDIAESPWTAVKEAVGGAAGYMLPMIATAPLGGALGAVRGAGALSSLARGAGAVVKKAGPVATMMPASYGGIREEQGEDAQGLSDKLLALGGAGAVAGIETAFGPQQWALATMSKEGREALAKKFGAGALPSRVAKGALRGAAVEGAEEIAQNPIEQLASYQSPLTPENLESTMFGGAMGAIGGGVLGGGFGVFKPRDLTKPAPPAEDTQSAPPPPAGPGAEFDQMAINPYDVGGHLTALAQGRQTELDTATTPTKKISPTEEWVHPTDPAGPPEPMRVRLRPNEVSGLGKMNKGTREALKSAHLYYDIDAILDHIDGVINGQKSTKKAVKAAIALREKVLDMYSRLAVPAAKIEALKGKLEAKKTAKKKKAADEEAAWKLREAQVVEERKAAINQKLAERRDARMAALEVLRSRTAEEDAAYAELARQKAEEESAAAAERAAQEDALQREMMLPGMQAKLFGGVEPAAQRVPEEEKPAKTTVPKGQKKLPFKTAKKPATKKAGPITVTPLIETPVKDEEAPVAEAKPKKTAKKKEAKDAVQKPSTAKVLPSEKKDAGETRGKRGRVEPEVKGKEAAPEGKTEKITAKKKAPVAEAKPKEEAKPEPVDEQEVEEEERPTPMRAAAQEYQARAWPTKEELDALEKSGGTVARKAREEDAKAGRAQDRAIIMFGDDVFGYLQKMVSRLGGAFTKNMVDKLTVSERNTLRRIYANHVMGRMDKGTLDRQLLSSMVGHYKFSEKPEVKNPVTKSGLIATLKKIFTTQTRFDELVTVYATQAEAVAKGALSEHVGRVAGWQNGDKIGLIAENIEQGKELGVFLHEVGVHLGMKKLVGEKNFDWLREQVAAWAKRNDGSKESEAAKAAIARSLKSSSANKDEEVVAYAVEELVNAGVTPKGAKPGNRWLAGIYGFMKAAMAKLGVRMPSFSGQNLVDLAFGAADIELGGETKAKVDEEVATRTYDDEEKFAAAESVTRALGYKTLKKEKLSSGKISVTRQRPGATTDRAKAPTSFSELSPAITDPFVGDVVAQAKEWGRLALEKVMFTDDLVRRAVKVGLESAQKFGDALNQKFSTRDAYEQRIAKIMSEFNDMDDNVREAANTFVMDSTMRQEWGFQPEWDKDAKFDPDSKAAKAFNALPVEARKVVKELFQAGHSMYSELQQLVNKSINDEYDNLRSKLDPANKDGIAEIEKARKEKLASSGTFLPKLEGPYAPLRRFGNYVVVGMSDEMREAKANNDEKLIAKLQADPNHYVVSHTDNLFQARQLERKLKENFPALKTESWRKEESNKHTTELPWSGIAKIKLQIEGLPEGSPVKNQMSELVTNMYLTMLSETSARKAELTRKGVFGADVDMFRAFASHGAASAHYIAALAHTKEINNSISDMDRDIKKASGEERNKMTSVRNELLARYSQSLSYDESPITNAAMKMTSFWMLITSPGYYIQNSLQPFMLSLPYMSGPYGWGRSTAILKDAYKDVGTYVIDTKSHQLDIASLTKLSGAERKMLTRLQELGKLDLTLTQDMGRFIEGDGFLDKGAVGKVVRKLWAGPQAVELLNRVSTAVAAYRLAKGKGAEAATDYANDVVTHTHGNYSSFNAPRFFTKNSAMRLVTQFRKYQLIQITLLARTLHDAVKSADPEERRAARVIAKNLLLHHLVMTGTVGIPLVMGVLSLFGSDDGEPEEEKVRKWIKENGGDEFTANLIMRGLPAALGWDLSGKVGMGNALTPLPFAEMPKDRASYEKAVVGSLGAAAGLGQKFADGLGKMRQGDYQKGLEQMMPKGISDGMKSYRYATEGVTNRNNDVTLSADDINVFNLMTQALGIPGMQLSTAMRKQGVVIEVERHFKEESSKLHREFNAAYKEKDWEAAKEIRSRWVALQKQRREAGLSVQSPGLLMKGAMAQRKRERMTTEEGIQYTRQNRALATGV